ncbi:MAG: cytochrome C oxidase subunit IV family protein [Chromatiaceae bacterium]
MAERDHASVVGLVTVYVLLLALLAMSLAVTYVHLGIFNAVANLGIAVLQAGMIMAVFMGLRWSSPLVRVTAIGGVFFLSFLVVLLFADYLTRGLA